MSELKPTIDDAISSALKLKELDKLIIKAFIENNWSQFKESIEEFNRNKKSIKIYFSQNPITKIPDVRDKLALDILHQVSSGIPFMVEKAFKGEVFEDVFSVVLSDEEKEELAEDMFHSWFSHLDYVDAMLEIGSLVLSVGKIPDHLLHFVDEMRQCYVFQQYAAVLSLCRTILEISVRDLCKRNGLLKETRKGIINYEEESMTLYNLIIKLCSIQRFGKFRNQLHEIRIGANKPIHGEYIVNSSKASEMLKQTLIVIHELYE